MNRYGRKIPVLLGALALVFAGAASAQKIAGSEIRIGVVTPVTGQGADTGKREAIGAQAAPSISGRELSVGASDVQQYLDGSFPRTQDALGGLIALTMSHPQLSLPAGERLNLGMDVALATAGGNPSKLGTVKLSSGLRYDAQTQGFHLQQPSVDDFTPANQGGRLDSRTRGLLNAWLSDYAQREPIYKLDPAVAGLLGALQVQSAQVKNGKLVVTFNQNLGNLVPAGVLGK